MFKNIFLSAFFCFVLVGNIYANNDNVISYDAIIQLKSNGVEKGFEKFKKLLIETLQEGKKSLLVETGRGQFFKKFPSLLEESSLTKFVIKIESVAMNSKKENAYLLQIDPSYFFSFIVEEHLPLTTLEQNKPEKKVKEKKVKKDKDDVLVSRDYIFPAEDELNLHSKSVQGAHDLVMNFIENAYKARKKIVLVITGKGNHGSRYSKTPGYKIGKIRQMFPEWIKEERIKDLIENYAQAQGVHGGEGAFYVVLK